jgi:hypothetical protein
MHAADLGVFQDAIGSLFYLEVMNKTWFRSKMLGLKQLNVDLDNFYGSQPKQMSRVTPLTMSQIKGKDLKYPYLKCKAAQTRHLAMFALVLARRHRFGDGPGRRSAYQFKEGSRLAGLEEAHLSNLVSMFEGMEGYARSCGEEPFREDQCRHYMYKFLQAYSNLNRLWRTNLPEAAHKHMPFNLRQKGHLLQHLVEDKIPMWGSPSLFWVYRDEDYIGAVKGIASKTKCPFNLEKRLLEKLMIWTKVSALKSELL